MTQALQVDQRCSVETCKVRNALLPAHLSYVFLEPVSLLYLLNKHGMPGANRLAPALQRPSWIVFGTLPQHSDK